ncbi:hypothetical protein EOD42_16755 [Rhodovarius crocodyli]|uniref:Uncharacterized protein n=1 Tax=Rhodovarius crocodyli TaxID=1979269 RepID=A0A437MC87_9PROT|nr:hypothetical protein [Rhodovarius crocodyli]RVT95235.1 hypothetical protein EOD42_16755 [Rhodovarius crocodyli]
MPDLAEKLERIRARLTDEGRRLLNNPMQELLHVHIGTLYQEVGNLIEALAASHRECMHAQLPGNSGEFDTAQPATSSTCNCCEKCGNKASNRPPPAPPYPKPEGGETYVARGDVHAPTQIVTRRDGRWYLGTAGYGGVSEQPLYTAAQVQELIEDENRNPWKAAIAQAMLDWHMAPQFDETPAAALRRYVEMDNIAAADPQVSERAAKAVSDAVAKEREAWKSRVWQTQCRMPPNSSERLLLELILAWDTARSRGGEG